jgi:hypothetical protein
MMTDYQLQPNARRCALTGRDLAPGDRYFSVLTEENGRLVRRDYSASAWQGPPADAFSFWSGRIPPEGKKRRLVLDEDTLRECFERLEGTTDPGKLRLRYVLALLILRQRRLVLEEARREQGVETLILRDGRTGRRFRVENPELSEGEILDVQDEVLRALGWDG